MKATEILTAKKIKPTPDALIIVLPDREVQVRWEDCSPRLAAATDQERMSAELSPGGYGIHWPLLDEDLSIGGLLGSNHGRTRS